MGGGVIHRSLYIRGMYQRLTVSNFGMQPPPPCPRGCNQQAAKLHTLDSPGEGGQLRVPPANSKNGKHKSGRFVTFLGPPPVTQKWSSASVANETHDDPQYACKA